jgi:hypothetical protein
VTGGKEAAIAYSKALYQHLPCGTLGHHKMSSDTVVNAVKNKTNVNNYY